MNDSKESPLQAQEQRARAQMAAIPHKVLVMSGKGGVGKTTVAVNLAYAFAERGLRVGLLDADVHGPDVPLMTGIQGEQSGFDDDDRLVPLSPWPGVRVLSIGFFITSADTPLGWRGPRKSGAIRQLLADGNWEGTDVLVVDCPPGTGDEPMAVAQLIGRGGGVVVVTSPQEVSLLDSRKCLRFVDDLDLPLLGIVENLSGYVCPHCGAPLDLFHVGGGERAAHERRVRFLGRVPISGALVEAGDRGVPIVVSAPEDPAARAMRDIADRLAATWTRADRAHLQTSATGG